MFEITEANNKDFMAIENIGKEILPIYYSRFDLTLMYYNDTIIYKLVENNDILAFIVCELFKNENRLHIMSIGVTKNKHRNGLGTLLLDYIKKKFNTDITLYVQVSNKKAIDFYSKSLFIIKDTLKNYYQNLEEQNAYLMTYVKKN
jgi:ribosomal protein S18 acetylase RimI-like enzyme